MSQTTKIKEYLETGKKITSLEALNKFGCFRLAARIDDINKLIKPQKVKSETITVNKKKVAQYSL